MGKLCSKQTQTIQNLVEAEKEFSLLSYKSDGDKIYDLQENKFNYFRKMLFQDFLYSLVQFSGENATLEDDYNKANIDYSMKQPFFNEAFSTDYLQSFIENKILKHKALYEDAGTHENIVSIFKEEFLEVNNSLGLKLSQNAKGKGDENADKNTIVKKGDVIAYGILYCAGANLSCIIMCQAAIESFMRDDEQLSCRSFYDLIENCSYNLEIKKRLHQLRNYRNKWIHINEQDNEFIINEEELNNMALFSYRLALEVFHYYPFI